MGNPSPIDLKQGWSYAVFPPIWPIGRTPRTRGGVRLTSIARDVHVVFFCDNLTERIFFIGGRDPANNNVDCTLTVELVIAGLPAPVETTLQRGQYVEYRHSPFGAAPSKLLPLRFDNLASDHPISVFLQTVQPGGSSGGGSAGTPVSTPGNNPSPVLVTGAGRVSGVIHGGAAGGGGGIGGI